MPSRLATIGSGIEPRSATAPSFASGTLSDWNIAISLIVIPVATGCVSAVGSPSEPDELPHPARASVTTVTESAIDEVRMLNLHPPAQVAVRRRSARCSDEPSDTPAP